ncbi:kinase inhibitor [Acetobacter indonesiensis]|jgi:Raf kinase inhibitor-like YbhB/YbcL family protein|uniref:Kinase inhibitor n=1 Tax=Acetobacter indonesiensis TaxID=104101 RepID=A0A252ATA8_9PROT|nr:kinase inhibitor [Acetobacter indonesiensis]MCG0995231.1 kinase inhibitor [Acetobacter indonesiensis]MCI1438137.1 kinase inhibitor [Acetobacter indonesiensis]MCI1546719.1 kinase inhibitor [Acetobacter indonesiensis]MCI1766071.1 kinase inhibitor [Acetobacter indonesiensis]OUI93481.1 kinase inhibitor [Acetobacter indonesiensis]
MAFVLSSPAFTEGAPLPQAQVYNGMGQTGQNLSPALEWKGAPDGTKSFVITVYDPDAPTGSGWWHWVVANIPATVTALPEGAGSGKGGLPEGALQIRTDFGVPGYGGAAPPPGPVHHYVFKVHALDVPNLEVTSDSSPALVGFMVHHHSLGSASLTAVYGGKAP